MTDQDEKHAQRREILERLNSSDTGPHHGDRRDKQSQAKKETERQKALEKGRRGLGWIGGI